LNVVNTSEPYLINGYGIRGKYILRDREIEKILIGDTNRFRNLRNM